MTLNFLKTIVFQYLIQPVDIPESFSGVSSTYLLKVRQARKELKAEIPRTTLIVSGSLISFEVCYMSFLNVNIIVQ